MLRATLFILTCLLTGTLASAQVRLTFPLENHYRIGKYLPLAIEGTANHPIRITSPGAIDTLLPADPRHRNLIAPLLTIGIIRELKIDDTLINSQLHPLADDERLIAFINADPQAIPQLFPGQKILPLRLDATTILKSPAPAWTTLDAIVIDDDQSLSLKSPLSQLASAGVSIAIRSQSIPPWGTGWEAVGGYWILHPKTIGPQGSEFSPAAYAPTYAWNPGWPSPFRKYIMGIAIVFTIFVLLISLWTGKPGLLAVLLLTAGFTFAIARSRQWQTPVIEQQGAILVKTSYPLAQFDRWSYQTSFEPIDAGFLWKDITYPIFNSHDHLEQLSPALQCDPAGRPLLFTYHLPKKMCIAFLSRQFTPSPAQPNSPVAPAHSAMRSLARQLYLTQEPQFLVSTPDTETTWGTVTITEK